MPGKKYELTGQLRIYYRGVIIADHEDQSGARTYECQLPQGRELQEYVQQILPNLPYSRNELVAVLHRIKRCSDGLVGGWVGEGSLSQQGTCFVLDDSEVWPGASVLENAVVQTSSRIKENGVVRGRAVVTRSIVLGVVEGDALVNDSFIHAGTVVGGPPPPAPAPPSPTPTPPSPVPPAPAPDAAILSALMGTWGRAAQGGPQLERMMRMVEDAVRARAGAQPRDSAALAGAMRAVMAAAMAQTEAGAPFEAALRAVMEQLSPSPGQRSSRGRDQDDDDDDPEDTDPFGPPRKIRIRR